MSKCGYTLISFTAACSQGSYISLSIAEYFLRVRSFFLSPAAGSTDHEPLNLPIFDNNLFTNGFLHHSFWRHIPQILWLEASLEMSIVLTEDTIDICPHSCQVKGWVALSGISIPVAIRSAWIYVPSSEYRGVTIDDYELHALVHLDASLL